MIESKLLDEGSGNLGVVFQSNVAGTVWHVTFNNRTTNVTNFFVNYQIQLMQVPGRPPNGELICRVTLFVIYLTFIFLTDETFLSLTILYETHLKNMVYIDFIK